jgi:hypothetical protein
MKERRDCHFNGRIEGAPIEMAGAHVAHGSDRRHQHVERERCNAHAIRSHADQGHGREIARRPGMPHGRVQGRRQKKQPGQYQRVPCTHRPPMRYGSFAIADEARYGNLAIASGASVLDFRAGVCPGTSSERSYIIGGHGGSPVMDAPVPFEHLSAKRRERGAAAARAARRRCDHGFGECLVDAVEQKPRAFVRHAHVSRRCRDRAGIPDAFEQPSLAGTNARAGLKNDADPEPCHAGTVPCRRVRNHSASSPGAGPSASTVAAVCGAEILGLSQKAKITARLPSGFCKPRRPCPDLWVCRGGFGVALCRDAKVKDIAAMMPKTSAS